MKGANKVAKIYVGRSTAVHNFLFGAHTPCMNYVTETSLLISFSVNSKQQLCSVHVKAKKANKNIQHLKNFVILLNKLWFKF